jgi:hypothetical protein
LDQYAREGTFERKSLNDPQYGPDSSYLTILAKHDGEVLEMTSWHELFEQEGRLVTTATGSRAPGDETKWEVLAKEPADYLVYRLVWSELRREVQTLVPHEGEPTKGKAIMDRGEMFWQEEGAVTAK